LETEQHISDEYH